MMKPGVQRPRVNNICKSELFDSPKSLKIGVVNDFQN